MTARFVSVDNSAAVVAIPDNSNDWPSYNRKNAEELLHQKFPQGYVIDHEEEVVTGTTTHSTESTEKKGDPTLAALKLSTVEESTHHTTYTTEKKEWRIWCHAADAAPPAQIIIPTAAALPSVPVEASSPPPTTAVR